MRGLSLFLVLLVAGCQSEARRLLVVDFTLADPLTLEATAAPWHAAGYRVEYRQFYPHLTRADLGRYRTIVVLSGREPESSSDALTIGDLAILNEWLRREGVVVLGYRSDARAKRDEGSLDRWVMNQWLVAQGAGITIGAEAVDDPGVPQPHSALDNAGVAPFPAGRNRPLRVRERGQALARAGGNAALVAASRVGDGLIVVASRSLLASEGADPRTADFLEALARWTRRPAEWASVGAASRPALLRLADAPKPLAVHAPPLRPPAGAPVTVLPAPVAAPRDSVTVTKPGWISRQGIRVLWSRFTPQSLDSLLLFVDVAALNALATVIPAPALADTIGTRNVWKVTAERMQATSIRWFPGVSLVGVASQGADEVDRHGELTPIACGLDSLFWRGAIRPAYRTLTRLGGARPEVITGVALDLDSAMSLYRGSGFCDADYRAGLAALGLDREETDRLAALPPTVRYDTLLERGWLRAYFEALQANVAERAIVLRGELRRLHPDVRFAFHATDVPADWFSLGLLRGFSTSDAPVLLWLREQRARDVLQRYRERQIFALSAIRLAPEQPRVRAVVFGENDGFWLDGTATDSLGRVIRRFTR